MAHGGELLPGEDGAGLRKGEQEGQGLAKHSGRLVHGNFTGNHAFYQLNMDNITKASRRPGLSIGIKRS